MPANTFVDRWSGTVLPRLWTYGAVWLLLLVISPVAGAAGEAARSAPVTVSFNGAYDPNRPEDNTPLLRLVKEEPRLRPMQWGGVALPGEAGRASFMMSIAGDTAPDVFLSWFHILRTDIDNGFVYPLNEWLGDDLNGNGQIDDDEAKWPGWKDVPLLWRHVATQGGKVYGLPVASVTYFGLLYRKDLVREAGLDPDKIPETWDEFYYWCQKLTVPGRQFRGARLQRGQRGFSLPGYGWGWLPWMQVAGGSPIVQIRRSPTTGKDYVFPMEETRFVASETGEDLLKVTPVWRANLDSPEALAATQFYQKMMWGQWWRDPETGEPVNLTSADIAAGAVTVGGRRLTFKKAVVINGVARGQISRDDDPGTLLQKGEIAIMFADAVQVQQVVTGLALPPEMVGVMPFPPPDRSRPPVIQAFRHYYSLSEGVGRRPKDERDLIWKCLTTLTSDAAADDNVRRAVLAGRAMWCQPAALRRLGFAEFIKDIPVSLRTTYERIERGELLVRTEPFAGFWMLADDLLQRHVLSYIVSDEGAKLDCQMALHKVNVDANSGLMFKTSPEVLQRKRPLARVLFGIFVIAVTVCVTLVVRELRQRHRKLDSIAPRPTPWMGWFMLAPALLSIAVWSYYPLLRGVVMAFQDYRVVGSTTWVGLDNFIAVATDANFWVYISRTVRFVGITLLVGFVSPIVLAFLLTEIPHGKIFFRTLFFLPQMTSGLVIALMWKMMYDPTENGILNRLLMLVGAPSQTWLMDPAWAMLCCILPGVWAGAGMASLIYVAALGSLPNDYYEAAAIDGAGILARFRHVAMPQLLPLVVINFVGAFIGAFQGMGSIFLLTFGGPGNETMVLSLAIWKEAYTNLRFSTATTMAWFLGTGLIGFTYLQIRFLRRVEFRRAETN